MAPRGDLEGATQGREPLVENSGTRPRTLAHTQDRALLQRRMRSTVEAARRRPLGKGH